MEGNYTIAKVMDILDLENCDISIRGKLTWNDDIQYWLKNIIGLTYAQRSTAWRLGNSNQNGRPISLTLWKAEESDVCREHLHNSDVSFRHTFAAYSENITMTNLDVNATSNSQWSTVNTDGFDSWNSKDIAVKNWVLTCGDDCISIKGNSSNIHVHNVTCHESGAMCIGSLGNLASTPDYQYIAPTPPGSRRYPGQGHVCNVTFRNINFVDVNQPIYVSPCIYSYSNCDGSRLKISHVTWENITGTSRYNVAAGIYCSKQTPCTGFKFKNINIKPKNGGASKVLCSNMNSDSRLACTGTCPAGWEQQLSGNA
ncbi:pectin lyase-like protein [Setomelanomma holmii]|uniref:galacturonan 1,4-alpha-galacturonidase n=1 Tax=Setomelanomma holmii TaxID=210430 RepID=A0A9P4LSS8_9PLEO|nr:pectin lyase-like protein [Setomelanomma holmii]